jgi:hypothetical protein
MLRRGEIQRLNLDDVHYDVRELDIWDAKNGQNDTIKVTTDCIKSIKSYVENHRGQPREGHEKALFLYDGRRISRTKLHEFHKIYRHKVGLPDNIQFYPHIWRHTGITHYAQTEKDPKTLQSQTRHRDINVLYERYVKKTDQELRISYDRAFELKTEDTSKSIQHKKIEPPEEPKTKKKDDSTDNYIANPGTTPKVQTVYPSNLVELEMKLIEQLANGEISNKVYNDAITRLENINKNHNGNTIGYQ